jgi:hypothetical protein
MTSVQDLLIIFVGTIVYLGVMWVWITIDDLKSDIRHKEIDINYNGKCIDDLRSDCSDLRSGVREVEYLKAHVERLEDKNRELASELRELKYK